MTPGSSQPQPTGQPAGRIKIAASKRIYPCTYPVQQCLYISWNVCSLLYTEHELHNTQYTGLYIVCTCLYDSKCVCTCINMYIHVWTMYVHVCSPECTYHVHTLYIHVYDFASLYVPCTYMYIHFMTCTYTSQRGMYYSIVWRVYVHGSDMYVHVYTRWVGFQMNCELILCDIIMWYHI